MATTAPSNLRVSGPENMGPGSIDPDNIDPENIDLGNPEDAIAVTLRRITDCMPPLAAGSARRRASSPVGLLCLLVLGATWQPVRAEEVTVAVAANFLGALQALEPEFEAATDHELAAVAGSTGQLYSQIVNGAPFDVLLAADRERPRLLADQRRGDPGSRFTYAVGRLALWSRQPDRVGPSTLRNLREERFRWLALAEPDIAPYGAAARQTLERLGAWDAIAGRIVRGQSVAQTFAMVETGNAELGFVALSQALAYTGPASYRVVPAELHDPIRQDAILLLRAGDNRAARDFLEFLRGPAAAGIMRRFGYETPGPVRQ